MTSTTSSIPESVQLDIFSRLDAIAQRQDDLDPELPQHLKSIHKALRQHDELAHLLSDEQIRILMSAQLAHTGIALAPAKKSSASKSSSSKSVKVSINDL